MNSNDMFSKRSEHHPRLDTPISFAAVIQGGMLPWAKKTVVAATTVDIKLIRQVNDQVDWLHCVRQGGTTMGPFQGGEWVLDLRSTQFKANSVMRIPATSAIKSKRKGRTNFVGC